MSATASKPRPSSASKAAGPAARYGGVAKDAPRTQQVGFETASSGDDRLQFVSQALIGYKADVEVKDGSVYEGIVHSLAVPGEDSSVVLHWAKPLRGPAAATQAPPVKLLTIPAADFVQLVVKDIDLTPEGLSGPAANGTKAFETDSEISRGRGGVERELTRWQPEGPHIDPGLGEGLPRFGRPTAGGVTGWDQFEVNRERFQVQSTWDENLYTTRLDKTKAAISVAEAQRIADEIEGKASSHRHVAEERNARDTGLQEMDEEDLYSAVARTQEAPTGSEPGRDIDAANSDTFGAAATETSGSEAGGGGSMVREGSGASLASKSGASGPAWASAGAGVAAVAGGGRSNGPTGAGGKAWERPGKVRTAPVPVTDPRREHIRVRAALTGGLPKAGMKASSPSSYGTPKGVLSPSAAAAAAPKAEALEALDLNPGVAKIDPSTRKAFVQFKAKQAEQDAKQSRDQAVSELRTFSHELAGSVSRKPGEAAPSAGSASAQPTGSLGSVSAPASARGAEASPMGPSLASASSTSSEPVAAIGMPAAAPVGGSVAGVTPVTNGRSESARPAANGQPPRPSTSSLNPNAKSFSFNPNAKEFRPTASAATTPAATPFATPAATPPATPASSVGGPFRSSSISSNQSFTSSHFGGPGGTSQWLSSRGSQHTPVHTPGSQRRKFGEPGVAERGPHEGAHSSPGYRLQRGGEHPSGDVREQQAAAHFHGPPQLMPLPRLPPGALAKLGGPDGTGPMHPAQLHSQHAQHMQHHPGGGPLAMSSGMGAPLSPGAAGGPPHLGGPQMGGMPPGVMGGPPGQWMPQPFMGPNGQQMVSMMPGGSPQQPAMVAYMQRPYGPPPGGFLVPAVPRPGAMGAGGPYAGGGMMYAPASPGMHPGAPRPMYPVPGMMMSHGMAGPHIALSPTGGPMQGPMGAPHMEGPRGSGSSEQGPQQPQQQQHPPPQRRNSHHSPTKP